MMLNGKCNGRVLFIGCVESSKIFLETLLECGAEIVGVITKESSSFNTDFIDMSEICEKNHIRYLYADNVNSARVMEFVRELKPDIGFCLGWSQLLGKELLGMFLNGVVGFHPAALPKNRGRHPIIWALVLGLSETASSFFMLDDGVDTGAVISQVKVPILYEDTARTLYNKIMDVAKRQLKDLWFQICEGDIRYIAIKEQEENIWRKRSKSDGKIDWRMAGISIYNLVRALSEPYPGAHFEYKDKEYKVWEVKELPDNGYENIEPGKIIKVFDDGRFIIKTGTVVMEVLRYDNRFEPKEGTYL